MSFYDANWNGKLRSYSCPRTENSSRGISGVSSYIDDIVVYSDSWEEHLMKLKELFGRLRRGRTKVGPTKCLLGARMIKLEVKGKSEQVQWNEAQERAYSLLKEYNAKNQY